MVNETEESLAEIIPAPELMGQVQVAKAFPRKLSRFTEKAMRMATTDQETAEACFYTLKRKDKKSGEVKKIQGPSIRLAEIVTHCFGNLRWGGRTLREEDRHVVCQGVAHDLEENIYCQLEVSRRITTSEGRRYGDDMITVTSMAAIAICMRNAAFKVIPAYLWKPVYDAAMQKAVGDASTLADRRQKMITAFAKMGVGVEKILAYSEKKTLEEITLEDLGDLIGAFNSIREGEQTIDGVFGTKPEGIPTPKSNAEAAATPPESPAAPSDPTAKDEGKESPPPPAGDVPLPTDDNELLAAEARAREEAEATRESETTAPAPTPAPVKIDRGKIWNALLRKAKTEAKGAVPLLKELTGKSGMSELDDAQVLELSRKLGS